MAPGAMPLSEKKIRKTKMNIMSALLNLSKCFPMVYELTASKNLSLSLSPGHKTMEGEIWEKQELSCTDARHIGVFNMILTSVN